MALTKTWLFSIEQGFNPTVYPHVFCFTKNSEF